MCEQGKRTSNNVPVRERIISLFIYLIRALRYIRRVGDLTLMLGHSGKKRSKSDRENSIGMKLVPVPASDFETGRDELAETLAVAYPWIRSTVCPNLIEVGYTFKL